MRIDKVKKLYAPALLMAVCLVAYLPLSSFLFAPKNDAYIYNFPNKFFFSECLRQGYIPFWNPYLNYGFPLHADPGFAWWHPLTWFFGLIGYNAYTFSIEILMYIYIGGLGMYWLGKNLNMQVKTAFSMSCMFMCSGFFIGNLQHVNFVTGAAFIPWLTCSWLLYQSTANNKHLLYSGLSAYLLFTAGHPAIPIGTIYFLSFLTLGYFFCFRTQISFRIFLFNQLKLLFFILLCLFPLIASYVSILPYYSRSEVVNHVTSGDVGFTLPSLISFILPFATIKNTILFETDVSMRNAYISLLGLAGFLFFLFRKEKKLLSILFLFAGIFMLIISQGGSIKEFLYEHLPGLQLIRTNGEYRVFTIFCLIICSGYSLDFLFVHNVTVINTVRKAFTWVVFFLSFFIIALSIGTNIEQLALTKSFSTQGIKLLIEHITFRQALILASAMALLISSFYQYTLRSKNAVHLLLIVLLFDLIVNSWMLLPITGVGKTSVATMQQVINKSPSGFPTPQLKSQKMKRTIPISAEEELLVGTWAWYDKQITHSTIDYPSQLKSTVKVLDSKDSAGISSKPFLFLKNQNIERINITSYSPTLITVNTTLFQSDTLILLQNAFKGWNVKIDHKPAKYKVYAGTFMGIGVNKGVHTIEWRYSPPIHYTFLIWISILVAVTYMMNLSNKR